MITNLMLDLETTGTKPGCCILSVGIAPFLTDIPQDTFYEAISHSSSRSYGFTDSPDTLSWWDKQKPDIQAEAFSGTRDLKAALESISFYMKCLGEPKEIIVWGNGKDFDNMILTEAFQRLGMKVPWDFRNNRCYRDLAAMYPMYPKEKIANAHNALADALAQARHATLMITGATHGAIPIFPC